VFDWEFRDPWFCLLTLVGPIVYHLLSRRHPASVMYSTLTVIDQAPRTLRTRSANLPAMLFAIAPVAMAIALAGPRSGDDETRIGKEGIAIVMVVDRSSSMHARDLVPTDRNIDRLAVVKAMFKNFVIGEGSDTFSMANVGAGRPDDVIGLVAFAGYADGLCPLTLDHGNLLNILEDVQIVTQRSEDGTALGEGLALAVERLRTHPARSKVAILLTDGVSNAGNIAPVQAAELAAAHNVSVYCIGAGTRGVAPIPVPNPFTGQIEWQKARVDIDETILEMIAAKTNGQYFRATDAQSLAQIYNQIDRLERTEITELRFLQYHEWYGPFVWIALTAIIMAGLLGASFFRRLP